jgi:hypothetical protein
MNTVHGYKIVAFAALGLLLGFGISVLIGGGYFKKWEKLSSRPPNLSEYFSEDQNRGNPTTKITKPCDRSSPEFSLFAYPPKNMVDCIQISEAYPDGSGRYARILDSDGIVWLWNNSSSVYNDLPGILCLPGLGLLAGVFIASMLKKSNQEKELS